MYYSLSCLFTHEIFNHDVVTSLHNDHGCDEQEVVVNHNEVAFLPPAVACTSSASP